jgi:predicted DNA-binding transcriptional regulator YafY
LVAIVLLLQTHGQLTVSALAERLESSERTIRRDLDSLSGAGVPVYPQRGRGGGWALLGGHRIDLSGLTTDEAQALFLVAGPNALVGVGVDPGVKSALRKLMAALPAPMREQASAAGNAVLVDPVGWGKKNDQPPHLDVLRAAVLKGVQVDISYAKPGQEAAPRRIHPYGLVSKGGTWYLLAGTEAGLRTFRLSRVQAVMVTEVPVERPEDFDLAEAWEAVQTDFPGRVYSNGVTVQLSVDPGAVRYVSAALGRWANLQPLTATGAVGAWVRYAATFPNPGIAAAELVRFGRRVEVDGPDEVRAALARLGEELVATYG